MLDQSFSADNFRKIFDLENRRGNYLEGKYFPKLKRLRQKVQEGSRELWNFRRRKNLYTSEEYQYLKSKASEKLATHKCKWEIELMNRLGKVSSEICARNFSFGMMELDIGQPKKVFVTDDTAAAYFALKQMQFNIRRVYKVRPSNRHQIICQLRELLCDKLPKYVVRTDVSSFYESIPRIKILRKLRDDPLLSLQTKKLIRKILHEYGQLTGSDRGVPRGIGISAYLTELYMRDFDSKLRNYPGVLYYARYVDDIVIIYCPPPNIGNETIEQLVEESFEKLGLQMNPEKTENFTAPNFQMTYLGYKFVVGNGRIKLRMSEAKLDRYRKRIDMAFSDYEKKSDADELTARRILKKRIDFLTGNTRLANNKKNIVTGIYFSNSLLTETKDLIDLDHHLKSKVATLDDGRLKARLQQRSFEKGFENKRYHKFSTQDLSEIVEAWKHAS